MTVIKNVRFSCKDEDCDGYVKAENGVISEVGRGDADGDIVIDGDGAVLYAGLCDIHTHGAKGVDFTLCSKEQAVSLENWYASCGVTSVFPTTTTESYDTILKACENIAKAAKIVTKTHYDGIHIEGPFLSRERRGAHNEDLLRNPDIEFVKQIKQVADGLEVRITVAPEIPGALEFIRKCKALGVHVTLGHSASELETVLEAIELGADCATHTFNGMNPLHHRTPGLLGAALAEDIYAEIICDGLHVHPEAVKLFSRAKGDKRAVLITDSIILAGCAEKDGVMKSAGMDVQVVNGEIRNVENGALAGSSLKLCDAVANYALFTGKELDTAAQAAGENAARAGGVFGKCGSVETGKRADFVLMDKSGRLLHTICSGVLVF